MARVQNIMKINKSESRFGATKAVQEQLKTTKIEENKGASFVFCRAANLTRIKGRNVFFIINASKVIDFSQYIKTNSGTDH